jgi:copper chaperone
VLVCPVSTHDEPELWSFLSGLCLESQRLRFFTGAANITAAAQLAAASDAQHYGLLAHDEAGSLVGHALYVRLDETRAEVAVEVADHLHGCGLATILIDRLAAAAEGRGISSFVAEVLPENRAMLDVFRDGFDAQVSFSQGTDAVEFPTSSWRLARERYAAAPVAPTMITMAERPAPLERGQRSWSTSEMEPSMSNADEQTYYVTGMSCEHCVAAVNAKVGELPGVSGVDVDLQSGAVLVRGSGVEGEAVRAAVEAAGYGLAEHA